MSLLDDVSIVVTPNGYKAGELYAVVPVPTEGSEEVNNGDFATDSGWSKTNAVISNSEATVTVTNGGFAGVDQAVTYSSGSIYKLSATIQGNSGSSGKEVRFMDNASNTGGLTTSNGVITLNELIQNIEIVWTANSNSSRIANYRNTVSGNYSYNIVNISVKEYTAADMDVTRATAATRVDEAGLVNYAEIIGSEEVTNGDFASGTTDWTVSSGTISVDNGRLKIDSLSGTTAEQTVTAIIGKTYKVTYDFTLGTATSGATIITGGNYPTLDAPEGTNIFYSVATSTSFRVRPRLGSDGTMFVDNISVKEVTRDNVPRIDYSGGGCPHILAEPQRTNLITYSEDFSSWTGKQSSITLTSNSTISPNGLQDATKIVFSDNSQTQLFQYVTAVSGTVYATSVFVKYKSGTDRNITIGVYDSGFKTIQLNFNTDGTIASTSTSGTLLDSGYEDYGNGWYRAYIVHTGATTGNIEAQINRVGLSNTVEEFYIYGEQAEIGSFPTSYIPTSGSTVTRNQDQFSRDGIGSLINSTEGVLFVEAATTFDSSTSRRITLSDGSISNRVSLEFDDSVENKIKAFITLNGASQILEYTATDLSQFNKIAIKWKVNDFAIWFNGIKVATDSNGAVPTGLNELSFDDGQGGNTFYGKVKQLQVYKTALTDTQLAALTS